MLETIKELAWAQIDKLRSGEKEDIRDYVWALEALAKQKTRRLKEVNLGERKGTYVLIEEIARNNKNFRMVFLKCDCGKERRVTLGQWNHNKLGRCTSCTKPYNYGKKIPQRPATFPKDGPWNQ